VFDQVFSLFFQLVVLSAKGNDSSGSFLTGKLSDTVAVQPCTIDHKIGLGSACRVGDLPDALEPLHRCYGASKANVNILLFELFGHASDNSGVVDDSLFGDFDSSHSAGMRLTNFELPFIEPAEPLETVLLPTVQERLESIDLRAIRRDNQFATDLVRDLVHLAKRDHLPNPFDGHLGLERTGFVVKSSVQHSAVMGRLMGTSLLLFFPKDYVCIGKSFP
jgi:hypothetical protein